jgi:DNA-binding winged helix-turn-helix (wHTH) protein/Tol biopolymer transport system component
LSMKTKVIYEFDQFCLDARERSLLREGKQIELTPKALNMLLVLVESSGSLLAKQELLERVWPGVHVDDHNLNVTIAMLRKALGRDRNGNQYIQTIPKEGYRFSARVHVRSLEPSVPEASRPRKTSEESDAWLGPPDDVLQQPEDKSSVGRMFRVNKWSWFAASIGLLGLAWIIGILLLHWRTSAAVHAVSLKQLTDDGRAKGNLRTDGTTLYFNETEAFQTILVSAPASGQPIHQIETPFPNVMLQDLSSDGKTLLVTSVEGIRTEGPLWTIPVQGGKPQPVGDAQCNVARWSPENRRIACAAFTKIILIDAESPRPQTVVSFPSPVNQVGWTPDGARLWFVLEDTMSHTNSQWEMEVNQNGIPGQAKELRLGQGCCTNWAWTPNNTLVYTKLDANGKSHLMIVPATSPLAAAREAALPPKIEDILALTPGRTDNTLYLATNNASPGELWRFNVEQQEWRAFLPRVSATYVAFSPDGQWITYENTQDRSLWRSRVDGSDPLRLTRSDMEVEVSSWSPDGHRIAFMGKRSGKPFRIFLIGRDGGPIEEASEGYDNQGGPSWSPDSRELVYGNVSCQETQNCWVRRLNLETRTTEIVPGSHGFRTARWSPDGKYVAALQWQSHELMLLDLNTQRWRTLAGSVTGDNINWSRDSQYVFVDSPKELKPVVERIRINDGQRLTVVSLAALQKVPGLLDGWIGLTPDGSPILKHMLMAGEIYELKWKSQY